jgi:hypothetical protein
MEFPSSFHCIDPDVSRRSKTFGTFDDPSWAKASALARRLSPANEPPSRRAVIRWEAFPCNMWKGDSKVPADAGGA